MTGKLLTPEALERMREDDRRFGPQIPLDLRGSLSDRRALLAHVDALQAQLDEARGVLRTARKALGLYVGNGEHEYEPCGDETGKRYAECCECQGESAIETIDAALSETGGER